MDSMVKDKHNWPKCKHKKRMAFYSNSIIPNVYTECSCCLIRLFNKSEIYIIDIEGLPIIRCVDCKE